MITPRTEEIYLPNRWGPSWGVTVGDMQDDKVFVLRGTDSTFFREWLYDPEKRKPSFRFVSILSCARAFSDKTLAEIFQKFLHDNKYSVELMRVERGRLIRMANPSPITRSPNTLIAFKTGFRRCNPGKS